MQSGLSDFQRFRALAHFASGGTPIACTVRAVSNTSRAQAEALVRRILDKKKPRFVIESDLARAVAVLDLKKKIESGELVYGRDVNLKGEPLTEADKEAIQKAKAKREKKRAKRRQQLEPDFDSSRDLASRPNSGDSSSSGCLGQPIDGDPPGKTDLSDG